MTQADRKPVFRGFDSCAPMKAYRRHLPHWRQEGATYFVTFRLADSIPERVLFQWQDEDRVWLKAHGVEAGWPSWAVRGGAEHRPTSWRAALDALPQRERAVLERRAARRMHVEIDRCHGSCLLERPDARSVVADSLRHFHGTRWWTGDFVVMPNHVHGLFQPAGGRELQDVLGSVKGFASARLTRLGAKAGRLWQQESYDRLVRDREELAVWRRYICGNPRTSGPLGKEGGAEHRPTTIPERVSGAVRGGTEHRPA
jgi:type I restriction enzyme R subunit